MDAINIFLISLAVFLAIVGSAIIASAFFICSEARDASKKKIMKKFLINGIIGLLLLWAGGIIIIYLYTLDPLNRSERNFKKEKEELPDISMRDSFKVRQIFHEIH